MLPVINLLYRLSCGVLLLQRSDAKRNVIGPRKGDEFLGLQTNSGIGLYSSDPVYPFQLLPPDSDNTCIGYALLQTLKNSREYTLAEIDEYLSLEKIEERYEEWVAMLINNYQYKSRRALFKNMKHCAIRGGNNILEIQPTRHKKLEEWIWNGHENDVVRLPIDSDPKEIGAALIQAFEYCD